METLKEVNGKIIAEKEIGTTAEVIQKKKDRKAFLTRERSRLTAELDLWDAEVSDINDFLLKFDK